MRFRRLSITAIRANIFTVPRAHLSLYNIHQCVVGDGAVSQQHSHTYTTTHSGQIKESVKSWCGGEDMHRKLNFSARTINTHRAAACTHQHTRENYRSSLHGFFIIFTRHTAEITALEFSLLSLLIPLWSRFLCLVGFSADTTVQWVSLLKPADGSFTAFSGAGGFSGPLLRPLCRVFTAVTAVQFVSATD
jgi:hypothetical protein